MMVRQLGLQTVPATIRRKAITCENVIGQFRTIGARVVG